MKQFKFTLNLAYTEGNHR